jgi:hypothetical protein
MKKYKLVITDKREQAEKLDDALHLEECSYNPEYLRLLGECAISKNSELQYKIYEL